MQRISDPLLTGGAKAYGFATGIRNFGYDRGALPVHKIHGIRVISVGNLRAGGSGKTPFAMWLARRFCDAGWHTALLLRGYRGTLERKGGLVSRGDGPLRSVEESGDEAFMAALRLPGVSIWVGADRVANAKRAHRAGADVAVLDDGFQHRALHRDVDILLASPEDLDPETRLLPRGPLRESVRSSLRADFIGGYAPDWQKNPERPAFLVHTTPEALVGSDLSAKPLSSRLTEPVYLLAGVARPTRFRETAKDAGFSVVGASFFSDHHPFKKEELSEVIAAAERAGAKAIVTTEKDLVRIRDSSISFPILGLRIRVEIESRDNLFEEILRKLH